MKDLLFTLLDKLYISDLIFKLSFKIYGKKHIRIVNYHETFDHDIANIDAHFSFFHKHYSNVTQAEFQNFMKKGIWNKPKPGIIITFDDGFQSNYRNAKPILEKYGLTGWFCIVTDFVDHEPPSTQGQFMLNHSLGLPHINFDPDSDERQALNWTEINELLNDNHVIISHTKTHHRMTMEDSDNKLNQEIVLSKKRIEEKTGSSPEIFCWVGGESFTYTQKAMKAIANAGYNYSFMTRSAPIFSNTNPYQIHRVNVGTDQPFNLFKLRLSGFYDLLYYFQRREINRKTTLEI
jgi:peptidoglycan/xylan/chitin deacetylase (PgdA/CDA1 family)